MAQAGEAGSGQEWLDCKKEKLDSVQEQLNSEKEKLESKQEKLDSEHCCCCSIDNILNGTEEEDKSLALLLWQH